MFKILGATSIFRYGTCRASICKITALLRFDFLFGKIDLMLYQVAPFYNLNYGK